MFKWLAGLFKIKEIRDEEEPLPEVNTKKYDVDGSTLGQTDDNPDLDSLPITDMLFYLFKSRGENSIRYYNFNENILKGFKMSNSNLREDFEIHIGDTFNLTQLLSNDRWYPNGYCWKTNKVPKYKYKLRWHKGASKCVRDGFYFLLKNEYYKEVFKQEEISKQKEIELAERREEELKVLDRLCIKKEK